MAAESMFSPTVESSISTTPFLAANPEEIIKSGKFNKVPIIFGLAPVQLIL